MVEQERIDEAIELAVRFGGIDGSHHKTWVIDQMVRALTGCKGSKETDEYRDIVRQACEGEDGPNTYDWDLGIPP